MKQAATDAVAEVVASRAISDDNFIAPVTDLTDELRRIDVVADRSVDRPEAGSPRKSGREGAAPRQRPAVADAVDDDAGTRTDEHAGLRQRKPSGHGHSSQHDEILRSPLPHLTCPHMP